MSSNSYIGKVTSSSSSLVYLTGIAPGGCAVAASNFNDKGDLSGLTDTPLPESNFALCNFYHYDNLAPIASGSGPAMACRHDNYVSLIDPCYGGVVWSPDTFIFEESYGDDASYYIPSTCTLQGKQNSYDPNSYVCSGNSIVRAVIKDGQCRWEGSTLACNNCVPQYAPSACNSVLGEHPKAPKPDGEPGTPTVPGPGPPAPQPAPSFSPPTPATPSASPPTPLLPTSGGRKDQPLLFCVLIASFFVGKAFSGLLF
mmetsp:Transcript_23224/g.37777  ORF Transcript_23224/g.37777 Transcript_23224/m.37777 type:complete len:256 (+) Transcript_23224:446-1213(+)|eukprot:CAMPEP_0178816458 /NCGR_PEP_ID=MMETSP0746-20121128/1359_1 /TAXON_ID=913974 /ORGANISM="Nitzschia punctata, Strain CCMP561" /LENGTH=255 /DNA_ID=CAMNT_0020477477 /DNA_START=446 /DNA_END=1213 /DNA_ORIENTATION=-